MTRKRLLARKKSVEPGRGRKPGAGSGARKSTGPADSFPKLIVANETAATLGGSGDLYRNRVRVCRAGSQPTVSMS